MYKNCAVLPHSKVPFFKQKEIPPKLRSGKTEKKKTVRRLSSWCPGHSLKFATSRPTSHRNTENIHGKATANISWQILSNFWKT